MAKMQSFLVTWAIDTDAITPIEAAMNALDVQRDETSEALVFDVTDKSGTTTRVDLLLNTARVITTTV